MKYASLATLIVISLVGPGCSTSAEPARISMAKPSPEAVPVFDRAFWKHWGDGLGELSAYELTQPRYGDPRRGTAVTIFVTEPFSNTARVKADPGKHPPSDEFPVMKLNLVEDFQTGVYDYNLMTSTFVALAPANGRPAGSPVKISFSSQEWCGHTYSQLLFDPTSIGRSLHSYFDGEADQAATLDYPPAGLAEDALWHWARGLAQPVLQSGESRKVPLLLSLQASRLQHRPLGWTPGTLTRSPQTTRIKVPAGQFEVETLSVQTEAGDSWTFLVEKEMPRRIISWQTSAGQRAELLGSSRLKYWEMNKPGGESALKKLGLSPRPPRTT